MYSVKWLKTNIYKTGQCQGYIQLANHFYSKLGEWFVYANCLLNISSVSKNCLLNHFWLSSVIRKISIVVLLAVGVWIERERKKQLCDKYWAADEFHKIWHTTVQCSMTTTTAAMMLLLCLSLVYNVDLISNDVCSIVNGAVLNSFDARKYWTLDPHSIQ